MEQSPEYLLLTKNHSAIAVTCYENERPLAGLMSRLDWRFHGMLSKFIREGVISGKKGEVVYVPATKQDKHFHIFVIGGGITNKTGLRENAPSEKLESLIPNLKAVGAEHLIISKSDFGDVPESTLNQSFKKQLQGVQLWIAN
ncbi:MAG: hypothetical protein KA715_05965 [Xanthomonadaceae bacterium]|nr:hypothetical protein [Xanthomonadaceae bacterium]